MTHHSRLSSCRHRGVLSTLLRAGVLTLVLSYWYTCATHVDGPAGGRGICRLRYRTSASGARGTGTKLETTADGSRDSFLLPSSVPTERRVGVSMVSLRAWSCRDVRERTSPGSPDAIVCACSVRGPHPLPRRSADGLRTFGVSGAGGVGPMPRACCQTNRHRVVATLQGVGTLSAASVPTRRNGRQIRFIRGPRDRMGALAP